MGKIILRRTKGNSPVNPYVLTTDIRAKAVQRVVGQIYVVPMLMEDGLVIGCGKNLAIHSPLAIARQSDNLTRKVYDCAVEYGRRTAKSLPDYFKADFIDETGGPRKIGFSSIGSKSS